MRRTKTFADKAIWITGASSGIGEAVAYRLAQEGARLILTARRADACEEVAARCKALGAKGVVTLPFDLAQAEGLEDLARQAWEAFGGVDVLFNNAGVSQRATAVETEMRVMRQVMEVDYFAPVALAKALLPRMMARGGGHLAVTTSITGHFGFPLRCAYSSAKHALYGFFETVAAECHDQGIRVTFVCPGRVRTRVSLNALGGDGSTHGQMDAGQAGGVSAGRAARKIVRALRRQRRETLVGGMELLTVPIKRFLPALSAWIARRARPT